MNPVDQIRTKTTGIANRSIARKYKAAARNFADIDLRARRRLRMSLKLRKLCYRADTICNLIANASLHSRGKRSNDRRLFPAGKVLRRPLMPPVDRRTFLGFLSS